MHKMGTETPSQKFSVMKPSVVEALSADFSSISHHDSINMGIQVPPTDESLVPFLSQPGRLKKGAPVLVWYPRYRSLFRGIVSSPCRAPDRVQVSFTPASAATGCAAGTVFLFDQAKFLAIYHGPEEEEEEEEPPKPTRKSIRKSAKKRVAPEGKPKKKQAVEEGPTRKPRTAGETKWNQDATYRKATNAFLVTYDLPKLAPGPRTAAKVAEQDAIVDDVKNNVPWEDKLTYRNIREKVAILKHQRAKGVLYPEEDLAEGEAQWAGD